MVRGLFLKGFIVKKTIAGLLVLGAAFIGLFAFRPAPVPDVTPPEARMGWADPGVVQQEVARLSAGLPKFSIAKRFADDNKKKRVVLWDAAKKVNGGKHLPTFRQEIGDCVSMGAANALNYLQCVILASGQPGRYRPAFQPWLYGGSRHDVGKDRLGCCKTGRCDGSVGIWAATFARDFGVLAADETGVPAYSGKVAMAWNCGPPREFYSIAKEHPLRTFAQVNSADDVRDAICNGYPVTIASNWGGLMRPPTKGGRLVNRRADSWGHQMVIIGYDGAGNTPYWYILNSWGENAHGAPPDDAPPGGFWVGEQDVTYIVRQGDSWAYSQFEGFPEQDLDFSVVRAAPPVNRVPDARPQYAVAF